MRYSYTLVAIVASVISCGFPSVLLAKKTEAAEEDSSAGLPEEYAKSYLVAANTVSPDKKFALIYPTLEAEEAAENANHPERNDYFDFIFVENTTFKLEGTSRVLIDGSVETSPNLTDDVLRSSDRAWRGHVQATWDIPQGKFTSKKVSGELRKKSEEAPD